MLQDRGPEYLTMAQAAAVLQVSKDVVRGLVRGGTLPASRWGPRLIRISRLDIERVAGFLAKTGQEAALEAQQAKSHGPR